MASPAHDWYLSRWLDATGLKQAGLERLTGWDKRKASFLVNGRQPYRRQEVNEAAAALNIEPFELLMHPEDAFALRRLRTDAIRIAAEKRTIWHGPSSEVEDLAAKKAAGER